MIQVAIIGAGFIGPAHLEALRRLGDVEVVALCDSRLEAAQRKARALNIAHAYDSVGRCWPIRGCRWCITARPTIYMPRLTGRSSPPGCTSSPKNRCV